MGYSRRIIRSPWTYRLLVVLWMGVLYWLSSQQNLPAQSLFRGQDKIEHALAFGLLGILFTLSFSEKKRGLSAKHILVVTLLVAGYGFFDEVHQYFVPGRDASFWDLCADTTGGFLAAFLFLRYRAFRASP